MSQAREASRRLQGAPPNEKESSRRVPELDGLRGIAILLVIIKHYGAYTWPGAAESLVGRFTTRIFPELYAPDLFLVITGFLLGSRLLASLNGPNYYSSFYLRRVCRTFPLYYVLLLFFVAAVLTRDTFPQAFHLHAEWPFGTPWSMAAYATFLQNFWIAATGSLGPSWLGITWTLAVQEQFYLILPVLLRCTPRPGLGYVITGLFLMGPLCRLVVASALPTYEWYGYDFLLFSRSDAVGIGVLAAWILNAENAQKWLARKRSLLCPATAVMFCGFAYVANSGYSLGTPAIFVLGHSYRAIMYLILVLIACFASQGIVGVLLRLGVLRELGRISYGLFLFHQMVFDILFHEVLGPTYEADLRMLWLAKLDAFLLTAILAELSWRYVEKPLIAWSHQ